MKFADKIFKVYTQVEAFVVKLAARRFFFGVFDILPEQMAACENTMIIYFMKRIENTRSRRTRHYIFIPIN